MGWNSKILDLVIIFTCMWRVFESMYFTTTLFLTTCICKCVSVIFWGEIGLLIIWEGINWSSISKTSHKPNCFAFFLFKFNVPCIYFHMCEVIFSLPICIKICSIVLVDSINSFLLLPNVVGTHAMISFMIRSMSFFIIHMMMWAWSDPHCWISYRMMLFYVFYVMIKEVI